jgi:7-carboxy-7-deazaguanine synthase (Cx14CxxC type)
MTYAVKEIFYTLQGEGANVGRPAVFLRFAGCNLWSGRQADRASALCTFCDTDFVGTDGLGGGRFDAAQLVEYMAALWPANARNRFAVLTGGEPALQVDSTLITMLHRHGFTIAIETNGTLELPPGIDWVCVSPKAGNALKVKHGQELKLVFPQPHAQPLAFQDLRFDHWFLQPMDGPYRDAYTQRAVEYCKQHPRWRLSVQMHKQIGIA